MRGRLRDLDGDDVGEFSDLSMESGRGHDGLDHRFTGFPNDVYGDGDGWCDWLREERLGNGDSEFAADGVGQFANDMCWCDGRAYGDNVGEFSQLFVESGGRYHCFD